MSMETDEKKLYCVLFVCFIFIFQVSEFHTNRKKKHFSELAAKRKTDYKIELLNRRVFDRFCVKLKNGLKHLNESIRFLPYNYYNLLTTGQIFVLMPCLCFCEQL